VGYVSVLRVPSLQVVGVAKVLENATDYSLGNTARHSLWLPTSREAKYKAKQAVDSFFMRAGDVLAAVVVFAGERLSLAIPAFGAVNAALAGLWMLIVVQLGAENRRRMGEAEPGGA
jgi:AAA family ATP:ADP antiporter